MVKKARAKLNQKSFIPHGLLKLYRFEEPYGFYESEIKKVTLFRLNNSNMNNGKIYVAGIGPGSKEDITPAVRTAIADSDVVIGYKYYFGFIQEIIGSHAKCVDTGMKKEQDRAAEAFRQAQNGKTVCVISSGDAGIYGMASPYFGNEKRVKQRHRN